MQAANQATYGLVPDSVAWGLAAPDTAVIGAGIRAIDAALDGYRVPAHVAQRGEGSAKDSVAARLLTRRGYLYWNRRLPGDTLLAFHAYREAVQAAHLMGENTAEAVRSAGYVASAYVELVQREDGFFGGDSAAVSTAAMQAMDFFNRAYREALAVEQFELAAVIEECQAWLRRAMQESGHGIPFDPPRKERPPIDILLAFALWAVWSGVVTWSYRRYVRHLMRPRRNG